MIEPMTANPPHDARRMIELPSGEPIEPPTRRKPWAAALLSLVVPGLGQLYAGAPLRALIVWAGVFVVTPVGVAVAMLLPGVAQIAAIILFGLGVVVLAMWDAARTARAPALAHRRAPYARWYVYTAIILVSIFIVQPRLFAWMHAHVATAYRIASTSMEPTLLRGDYILTVPLRGEIARGDLIVHRTPAGTFVKRVVALPGDTVAMQNGRLTIDGRAVSEPYAQWGDTADMTVPEFGWQRAVLASSVDQSAYQPSLRTWGPLVIPRDEYFLLGDFRDNSLDSRYLGLEPRAEMIGRPTIVYLSADSGVGVRWSRIGRRAE